jgi:hypothetical protein
VATQQICESALRLECGWERQGVPKAIWGGMIAIRLKSLTDPVNQLPVFSRLTWQQLGRLTHRIIEKMLINRKSRGKSAVELIRAQRNAW